MDAAASRLRARFPTARPMMVDVFKFALLAAVLAVVMIRSTEGLGYHWQWYRVPRYLLSAAAGAWLPGPLLQGLFVTLQITAVGLVLASAFGLVTALMRLSNSV